jgi:transcriptional regulator with XRE-family HTH domain
MGNTLEQLLKEKGLSLYRLGKETGIPYSSLHAFKSSQEKLAACSSATLFMMAKALDVPMERFFEDGKLRLPKRFACCFWDIDMESLTKQNIPFVVARLYERGGIDGIRFAEQNFTKEEIVNAILSRRDFSPVTANFLAQRYGLKKEKMAYYRYGGGQDWRKVP